MSVFPPPAAQLRLGDERGFASVQAAAAAAPLNEIRPAAPGDAPAALGFALAWALSACPTGLIVLAASELCFAETGWPHAEGLARYGAAFERLMLVRARKQNDALWASEEALRIPNAFVLCLTAPEPKSLSLTATRRLLLAAERHGTRCLLARFDTLTPSAAWTRWAIAAAPSRGEAHELGAPAFRAELERHRTGPAGFSWDIEWHAHARAFHERTLAGALVAASGDRPAPSRRLSA